MSEPTPAFRSTPLCPGNQSWAGRSKGRTTSAALEPAGRENVLGRLARGAGGAVPTCCEPHRAGSARARGSNPDAEIVVEEGVDTVAETAVVPKEEEPANPGAWKASRRPMAAKLDAREVIPSTIARRDVPRREEAASVHNFQVE